MARKTNKRRVVTVDFEGVESGGRSCPDGTYPAVIDEVEEKESQSSGQPMLVVKWKITEGKNKGTMLWDNLSLQPQALWRLKGLLEALGEDVPDSSMEVDIGDLEGKEAMITVTNEKFEGKDRPRVTDYSSIEDKANGADKEDEDERPGKLSKTAKKASKDEEEDEEEEEEKPTKPTKKIKVGAKVKFKDEKNKTVKGTITKIDGDEVTVSDEDDDDWALAIEDLTVI